MLWRYTCGKGKIEITNFRKGRWRQPVRRLCATISIETESFPPKSRKNQKDLFENVSFLQQKVKEKDVIIFSRQFSTMIDAGLPIIQCLEILHSQGENASFKKILKEIKDSVEGGSTLADALKRYPKQFDNLFVNMVAAGEAGGILDVILKRLSGYMEKAAALKRKVKGAMVYPGHHRDRRCRRRGHYPGVRDSGVPGNVCRFRRDSCLHLLVLVIGISNFVKDKILWIIIGGILFAVAFRQYYKTSKGQLTVDALMLKLPVFGMLLAQSRRGQVHTHNGNYAWQRCRHPGRSRYRGQDFR